MARGSEKRGVKKVSGKRIKLRPYHPTWLVGYFGMGGHPPSFNSVGFNDIIEKIKSDPEIEVEFVEGYDDICGKCSRLQEDAAGSIWGKRHKCTSSENPETVESVRRANQRFFEALGLSFGSVVKLKDLVAMMRERLPVLDEQELGGPGFQKQYEHGLTVIAQFLEDSREREK